MFPLWALKREKMERDRLLGDGENSRKECI